MLFAIGLVALFALNVADLITTQAVLDRGGKESNPVLAFLMKAVGPSWGLVKMGIAVVAIVILWMVGPGLLSGATLVLLIAAWAWVVWHNWGVMQRQKARGR